MITYTELTKNMEIQEELKPIIVWKSIIICKHVFSMEWPCISTVCGDMCTEQPQHMQPVGIKPNINTDKTLKILNIYTLLFLVR